MLFFAFFGRFVSIKSNFVDRHFGVQKTVEFPSKIRCGLLQTDPYTGCMQSCSVCAVAKAYRLIHNGCKSYALLDGISPLKDIFNLYPLTRVNLIFVNTALPGRKPHGLRFNWCLFVNPSLKHAMLEKKRSCVFRLLAKPMEISEILGLLI